MDLGRTRSDSSAIVSPRNHTELLGTESLQIMTEDYKSLVDLIRSRAGTFPALATIDVPSLVQPSIRLKTFPVAQDDLGLGASRIGGTPDVPPWWEWPRWGPREGLPFLLGRCRHPRRPSPLGFIAQIDLAAMPRVDDALPSSGWLYFFYDRVDEPWDCDVSDRGCFRVIHVGGDRSRLVRAKLPVDLEAKHVARPCRVTAEVEPTLPDELPGVACRSPAWEAYRELSEWLNDGEPIQHRLLGHAQAIQNPMENDCVLASNEARRGDPRANQVGQAKLLAEGARDWRLLLQIDTDEEGPGWTWSDAGRIYFWIKREDLCSLRFDDLWLFLQCS